MNLICVTGSYLWYTQKHIYMYVLCHISVVPLFHFSVIYITIDTFLLYIWIIIIEKKHNLERQACQHYSAENKPFSNLFVCSSLSCGNIIFALNCNVSFNDRDQAKDGSMLHLQKYALTTFIHNKQIKQTDRQTDRLIIYNINLTFQERDRDSIFSIIFNYKYYVSFFTG